MPRTKASKKDDRTPLEKLEKFKDSKLDLFIFFKYYDGLVSNGLDGFVVDDKTPAGSVKHQHGTICEKMLKPAQFRSKARKLFLIALKFSKSKEDPLSSRPPEKYRVTFSIQDFENFQAEIDKKNKKDPMKALLNLKDEKAKFVFFRYYDGIKSDGRIGFSLKVGGFGSISHMRVYPGYFQEHGDSWFRRTGKILGPVAKEFVDSGIVPPDYLRPPTPGITVPQDMLHASRNTIYDNDGIG